MIGLVASARHSSDVVLDEDLPAYLTTSEEAAAYARPSLAGTWAGVRRLVSAVADAHAAFLATPPASLGTLAAPSTMLAGDVVPPPSPIGALGSGGFLRMMELPGYRLGAMLDEWWASAGASGSSTIGRRLRLGPPHSDTRGGWTITGEIRRMTRWHWTPVVLELWPKHERWTMVTMTPQAGVFTTRRYFRGGHAAIERLVCTLAATRAAQR